MYWPALLLSAGLQLPDEILIHGFLTVDGRKMSKTLGNVVDPVDCTAVVGTDGLRYYLLRSVPPFEDGDFTRGRLIRSYNPDIANGLGNLASRIAVLAQKSAYAGLRDQGPQHRTTRHKGISSETSKSHTPSIEGGLFDRSLQMMWNQIRKINREIDTKRPWELLKKGGGVCVQRDLERWIAGFYRIALNLAPFLPQASARIIAAVARSNWEEI